MTAGKLVTERAVAWWGFSAGAAGLAYSQSQTVWGESNGKFHFKSDWGADHLAMSDEVSHLLVGYRLFGLINGGNRWVGLDQRASRKWAAIQAWALTTLVEFPIDAYNPTQGFGVSDMIFNAGGVALAWRRAVLWDESGQRPRWDVKISVKKSFFNGDSRLIADTWKQYDDFVYWLTYRPTRNRWIPLLVGIGYSSAHRGAFPDKHTMAQLNLGIGTSIDELVATVKPDWSKWGLPFGAVFLAVRASWTIE